MLSLMMKSESEDPYNDQHEDSDKKSSDHLEKRRIANSNERRRMQNINAGFESVRAQLSLSEGQKYSKASILQHAAQHLEDVQKELAVCKQRVKVYETAKLNCTCGSFNQADQESKVSEKCLESNLQDEGIGSPRDDGIIDDRYEIERQQKTKPNNLTVATKQTPPVVTCSSAAKFIKPFKGIDPSQPQQTVAVGTTLRPVQVLPSKPTSNETPPNKKYTSPNILLHEGRSPRLLAVQGKPRHLIITGAGGKDSPTSKLIQLSTTSNKTPATTTAQQQRVSTNCITLLSSNLKTPRLSHPLQKFKIESKKRPSCEVNNQSPLQHKYTKVNITPTIASRLLLNNQENHQPPTSPTTKPPLTFKPINCDTTTTTTTTTDDDKSVKRGGVSRLITAAANRKQLIGPSSNDQQQQSVHISPQHQQRHPIHISTLATTSRQPGQQQQENTFLYKARIKTTATEQQIAIPPTTSSSTSSSQEQLTLNQLNMRYAPVTITSTEDTCDVTSSQIVVHHQQTPSAVASALPPNQPTTGPNVVTVQSVQDNENSPCRIGHVEVVIHPDDEVQTSAQTSGTSTPMVNNNQGNQLNTILAAIDQMERQAKRTKSQEESSANVDS